MGNFVNPSVLAAMAGITNGDFSNHCLVEGGAGFVTIGGYSIGKEMIRASIKSKQRGRNEFILNYREEEKEIHHEISKISDSSRVIINLRVNTYFVAKNFAIRFRDLLNNDQPTLEINAHCRQTEIVEKGGGQGLLQRIDTLEKIVKAFQSEDFKVSLKIRGNTVPPSFLIPQIEKWHLDFLHIDSYKEGSSGTDLKLLNHYTKALDIAIIGNNSVIDLQSALAILNTGASYFSIARAAQRNPSIFSNLLKHF